MVDVRVTGRVVRLLDDPLGSFSIYEPAEVGCGGGRRRTSDSSLHYDCEVAMNGGFFAIDHPAAFCLNAVVSDTQLLQTQASWPTQQPQSQQGSHHPHASWSDSGAGGGDEFSEAAAAPSSASSSSLRSAVSYAHANVHFGLISDGRYFIGHVDDAFMQRHSASASASASSAAMRRSGAGSEADWHFVQLVSGLVWLVKAGRVHVNDSWWREEDQSTPIALSAHAPAANASSSSTPSASSSFITAVSARTAIGHDAQGRLLLVVVDGKTGVSGVSLDEMADVCVRLGLLNAINLDGGGSATLTQQHVLVNTPSDDDPTACTRRANPLETCEREVTTIACIHRFGLNRGRWAERAAERSQTQQQPMQTLTPHVAIEQLTLLPACTDLLDPGQSSTGGAEPESWQSRWSAFAVPSASASLLLLLMLLALLVYGVWWDSSAEAGSGWAVRGGGGRGWPALRWQAPLWCRSRRGRLGLDDRDRSEMEEEEDEEGEEGTNGAEVLVRVGKEGPDNDDSAMEQLDLLPEGQSLANGHNGRGRGGGARGAAIAAAIAHFTG